MTLKSSSSTDKKTMTFLQKQKSISRRRLVLVVLSCLYFFAAHILGTMMILASRSPSTPETQIMRRNSMMNTFSTYLGTRYPIWFFVIFIAAVLAIQGFSYLYDQRKVDFYESQPVARKDRFFTTYINGILIYVIPCVVSLVLAVLILMANGYLNSAVLTDIAYGALRTFLLFLGCYHVALIATFLTGNVVMAGMMTAFLLIVEPLSILLLDALRSSYLKTFFSDTFAFGFRTNPIDNYMLPGQWGSNAFARAIFDNRPDRLLAHVFSLSAKDDIVALIIVVLTLFIAYLLYKNRRNEMSSVSIAFEGVKPVLKFVVGILGSLCSGMLIRSLFSFVNTEATWFTVLIIIIAGIVICCFAEVIYDMNIHAMFRHAWHIPVVVFLSLLVFFTFEKDLLKYDERVPKASSIKSGALYLYNQGSNYFDDDLQYLSQQDFVDTYMFLKDAEAIAELGEIGQKQLVQTAKSQSSDEYYEAQGWQGLITYRLKSGRKIVRRIEIPYDVDESLMNRLMGTEEYKEGNFLMHHDDPVRALEGSGSTTVKLVYSDGVLERGTSLRGEEKLYSTFAEAYKKDLEKYSFSMIRKEAPCGIVRLDLQTTENSFIVNNYVWLEFPVYKEYKNTLAFLKDEGLELPTDLKERAEEVREAYVDWNREIRGENDDVYYEYRMVTYTDKETIAALLEKARPYAIINDWSERPEGRDEYSVRFVCHNSFEEYPGESENGAAIREADLPGNVLRDLENATSMQ